MARSLGIECKKHCVYLALGDDGVLVDSEPQKLDVPAIHDETARLRTFLADFGRVLAATRPDVVRIIQPETVYAATYGEFAPKAALETLIRLACADAGVNVEVLQRVSARSRTALPRKGKLDALIAEHVEPHGKYWNAGRKYAALAALAEER